MAWKVNEVMEQRFELIQRWKEGLESVSELAGRFSVSRKTVYKWIGRYEEEGAGGLQERSRAPLVQARRTPGELEEWIVDLRLAHPTWGPRKLRHWLLRRQPEQPWPAESTMGLILARHELNGRRIKRRHATPSWQPLAHAARANDVWAIDFKGWFYCGAERCDPLTVSDAASRYLLCCRAMAGLDSDAVKQELTPVFRRYGLPARLRSDNGSPFASTGVGGLTPLNVWWVRLGIIPERIEPGEPQQNGRHERLHRTLKAETANPPASHVVLQQQRFDDFKILYNEERPHEALHGATPADHYRPSVREFPEQLPELHYPAGMALRRADQDGKIRWKQARCRVGHALAHQVVGLEAVDDGVSRVWFGPLLLGLLDERKGHSKTAHKEDSHWPPLKRPAAQKSTSHNGGDQPQNV